MTCFNGNIQYINNFATTQWIIALSSAYFAFTDTIFWLVLIVQQSDHFFQIKAIDSMDFKRRHNDVDGIMVGMLRKALPVNMSCKWFSKGYKDYHLK